MSPQTQNGPIAKESAEKSTPSAGAPPASCRRCRVQQPWWHSYREVLLSTETLASVLGLALLAMGWVMAWAGSSLNRWFYLAAALVCGLPILRSCLASLRERRISV